MSSRITVEALRRLRLAAAGAALAARMAEATEESVPETATAGRPHPGDGIQIAPGC
jgi:hypothetical protein